MDEDSKQTRSSNGFDGGVLPEVEAYAFLLVVTFLIDADHIEPVSPFGLLHASSAPVTVGLALQVIRMTFLEMQIIGMSFWLLPCTVGTFQSWNKTGTDAIASHLTGKANGECSHGAAQQLQQEDP